MCEHGTTVDLPVTVPAHLSHDGRDRAAVKPIDACIAPIVAALNEAGIVTESSCCGHGKTHGEILLSGGRVLHVFDPSLPPKEDPQYRELRLRNLDLLDRWRADQMRDELTLGLRLLDERESEGT